MTENFNMKILSLTKSVLRLGNNEVLKTLMKTLIFVDSDANAGGSTTALSEC